MSNNIKPVVFITGASGMLGQQLMTDLSAGYQPVVLQRDQTDPHHSHWNYQQTIDKLGIKAPYAIIHLAGAGIADKRWTKQYKQLIYDSRINGTNWLVQEIQKK